MYQIHQLKKYLNTESLSSLVHTFAISHIAYCNILYFNLFSYSLNKLQRIQNFSARLRTQTQKFQHIKPIFKQFHWLPVKKRINLKIALQVFKCLNGHAPKYVNELLCSYIPVRSSHSSKKNLLISP